MNSIKDLLKEECKPREFWILRQGGEDFIWDQKPDIDNTPTHVIEASYAHRLKEALEIAVEALEKASAVRDSETTNLCIDAIAKIKQILEGLK